MNGIAKSVLATAIVSIAGVGCQNKLYEENQSLRKQNLELQSRLTDTDTKLRSAPDPNAMASMQSDLAARDARINELQQQLAKPAVNSTPEESGLLKGIEVTRDTAAGTLTVNVPGDVLFSPGSADLKPSAKSTLDKIASAIKKDYSGKHVIVQGYTDTDPISKTKGKWDDNLDLSAARSRAVAKYLTSQGLDPKNVGLQAYGETMPKGSKDKSRRVEIVVKTK